MSEITYGRKLDFARGLIDMTHGAGGKSMYQLIEEIFLPAFDNSYLNQKSDHAVLPMLDGRLVCSTDAHVVSPLFFPGGDIGSLAVYGTVNDVAVSGAEPLYLSVSFILEEGLPLGDLKRIAQSMRVAASKAGVSIVTGDTKVVEKGKGDGIFISTTGIGVIRDTRLAMSPSRVSPGDSIIVSGTMGDHGIAVLSQRKNLEFDTPIVSDSAPLHELVRAILRGAPDVHCMRDPTRGGLSATLNEIAHESGFGIVIEEGLVPVQTAVSGACELLGIDPLNVANEGKLVVFCAAQDTAEVLAAMREHPLGQNAALIGEVRAERDKLVDVRSAFGGSRVLHWLAGEQLPRIC